MQQLFLTIAGFTIKLVFRSAKTHIKLRDDLMSLLIKQLHNFLYVNRGQTIHATIDFIDKPTNTIIYNKKNSSFMEFFQITDQKNYQTFYHISLYQFYSLLAHVLTMLLSQHGGITIHASAALIQGKATIFLGHSGAGKSTIIQLLRNKYPILADDHVIIRKKGAGYVAYQTPYPEREAWFSKNPNPLPIGKMYFLKKGLYASERIIQNHEKLTYLLENVPLPEIEKNFYIKFIMHFVSKQRNFYEFTFPKNQKTLEYYFQQIHEQH